jgi:hypothetical protein
MLGAQGLSAGSDLYRATPTGFYTVSSERPVLYSSVFPIVASPRKTGYIVAFSPGESLLYSRFLPIEGLPHSRFRF